MLRFRCFALLAGLVTLAGSAAAADKYKVEKAQVAPPEQLAPEIRQALGKTAYHVSEADKRMATVWLRNELPLKADFYEQLEVKYPFEPGLLVGAIQFTSPATDYRDQDVEPGVYTLRYALQPQDGNHVGTAIYRDFLLLAPADQDRSLAKVSQEKTEALSKKAVKTTHPGIFSLLPPSSEADALPRMVHEENLDLWAVAAETTGKAGDETKPTRIVLVLVGHAIE